MSLLLATATASSYFYTTLKIGKQLPNAWNVLEVVDRQNNPTIYIAVRGEFESAEAEQVFQKLLPMRKVIGLCSYQNFPKLTCNPYQNKSYPQTTEELFLTKYGNQVILWCHCFRDPKHYIPPSIPCLLFSETDQYPHIPNLLAIETEKSYDCFVSMPDGEWNAWIRGLPILQRWLNHMADVMHLKILVCGTNRRGDFSERIDVIDFQPWSTFLKEMSRAKFLFNAASHDASPRILLEAIGLGLPVLVNETILGGWKYINRFTGDFFCPNEPIGKKIQTFLDRLPQFKPRAWLKNNFNREQNMQTLASTLNILQSFRYEDILDAVVFINLANRPDRRQHIQNELTRVGVPSTLIHRLEAIEDTRCGHLGCTYSHVKALEMVLTQGWSRVLILEDDFTFQVPQERLLYMVNEFIECQQQAHEHWDVLMFTAGWKEYVNETDTGFIKRLQYGTTAAGYFINGSTAIANLLQNMRQSQDLLEAEVKLLPPGKRLFITAHALDMHWREYQAAHRFYITEPMLGRQSNSRSSIMN